MLPKLPWLKVADIIQNMKQWPHAPVHFAEEYGSYMVTAATRKKWPYFDSERRLQFLNDTLLDKTAEAGWVLQAWAVFPNHYHFIATSPDNPENLAVLIKNIHGATSKLVNDEDGAKGRTVWFQYWDSRISYQKSYYARLNYVHNNPVHHGVVDNALKYKWCSAAWFEKSYEISFQKTVHSFKTDRVKVPDDF